MGILMKTLPFFQNPHQTQKKTIWGHNFRNSNPILQFRHTVDRTFQTEQDAHQFRAVRRLEQKIWQLLILLGLYNEHLIALFKRNKINTFLELYDA